MSIMPAGVDHTGGQCVNIPFPDMAVRLRRGDVDAAFTTKPTQTIKTLGAVPVHDPTTGFPTAGYGATARFVAANSRTVAASSAS